MQLHRPSALTTENERLAKEENKRLSALAAQHDAAIAQNRLRRCARQAQARLCWALSVQDNVEWGLDASKRHELARFCIKRYLESGDGHIPGVRGRVAPQAVRIDECG
jgi:hypothetical protein